jgi:hypothetical protein
MTIETQLTLATVFAVLGFGGSILLLILVEFTERRPK